MNRMMALNTLKKVNSLGYETQVVHISKIYLENQTYREGGTDENK